MLCSGRGGGRLRVAPSPTACCSPRCAAQNGRVTFRCLCFREARPDSSVPNEMSTLLSVAHEP